ncbi:MAG: hypothetical protein KKH92_06005 [Firmicutes bacterium]|nr:hypothetical protein [Bacillota bacterium]
MHRYTDIHVVMMHRYNNYLLPHIPQIITNYIMQNPEHYETFLDKKYHINALLKYLYLNFNNTINYQEETLLCDILKYFEIDLKEDNHH